MFCNFVTGLNRPSIGKQDDYDDIRHNIYLNIGLRAVTVAEQLSEANNETC
jgi:hypothetical protein